jgi:hypothetical protein
MSVNETATDAVLAWHWVKDDRTLRDGSPLVIGEWLHVDPPIKICEKGLHASRRVLDALQYAPGSVCCRVEMRGIVADHGDKLVATDRRVLWAIDATMILHEFACRCAEGALALVKHPDPRSAAAIAAKRAWMRGEITDAQLAAARAAALDAAWYAAGAAARAAALDAAWDAAWDAARAAAWDAQNAMLLEMIEAAHDAGRGGNDCASR